jgi:F0F1-type ATP synthase epsilon subunit
VINPGVLQILDESDHVTAWYFIDNGVADIAENVCKISTRHFVEHSHIDVAKAQELKVQEPENTKFYNMIVHYLENFG